MSATISRRESLRDALVSKFSNISTANGYRTDVKLVSRAVLYPDEVTNHPTICVILGDEPIQQLDMNRTVFNSTLSVVILGYYEGELEFSGVDKAAGDVAGEKLFHDMKRCLGAFILEYVNDGTTPWHVMGKDIRGFGPVLDPKRRKGECRIEFDVQLQRQDVDF
jgi:hypothetical protein